ncbi:MAG: hypothetical protein WDZ45_02500 [Flavobacteriaceae bacterium]
MKNINQEGEIKNVIKSLLHLQAQINLIITTLNSTFDSEKILKQIDFETYPNKISYQTSVNTLLSNYSIIMFTSFLEEYNKKFTSSFVGNMYDERITRLKQKNKPGIRRINKWKDIFKFRNHLVAHGLRINNRSLFSYSDKELNFKIPDTNSEKNLFNGIIYLICLNIRDEFIDVVKEIDPQVSPFDKFFIISEVVDCERELMDIFDKIR